MNEISYIYRELVGQIMSSNTIVPSTKEPTSVGSCFGKKNRNTKELLGVNFNILCPEKCIIDPTLRQLNMPFAIANCIWTLSGSNDLEFIEYYNSRGKDFSDDGETLYGSHGGRLFGVNGGRNQIKDIIEKLNTYRETRRAVAQIFEKVDISSKSKDIPCMTGIQFLIRDNFLHLFVNARSQSVLKVMPYDIIAFIFLQKALAICTKTKVGTYHHNIVSAHIYENEFDDANQMLNDKKNNLSSYSISKFDMPSNIDPFKRARQLKEWSMKVRQKKELNTLSDLDIPSDLEPFWKDILLIMSVKHAENQPIQKEIIRLINPGLKNHIK